MKNGKDEQTTPDTTPPVKRRGRPVGSKSPRPDREVHADEGDNAKYINHSMSMWGWEKPDMYNPAAVEQRVCDYFNLCAEHDMKPSVAGIALAFNVSRKTIWAWANGVDCQKIPVESRNYIKKAYNLLTAQMEDYMQNGKINPVAGIFLMKNNMDYKDQQEIVAVANNPLGETESPELLQEKYANIVTADFEVIE